MTAPELNGLYFQRETSAHDELMADEAREGATGGTSSCQSLSSGPFAHAGRPRLAVARVRPGLVMVGDPVQLVRIGES